MAWNCVDTLIWQAGIIVHTVLVVSYQINNVPIFQHVLTMSK